MPISYPEILDYKTENVLRSWTDLEPMLYALGTGMGTDPLDERELPFVYERGLKVIPTFATIIAKNGDPSPLPLDRALILDGGRELTLHRTMRAADTVRLDGRIISAVDRGAAKGAIITREVVISDAASAEKIATLVTRIVARGDGGFGGPRPQTGTHRPRPSRDPDLIVELGTRLDQALLYRLSGDRNPLHSDPSVARQAGFDRPILHGLCTYGICCRAILQSYADYDPGAIRYFAARFTAPTLPGDTIIVDIWANGRDLAFEANTKERGVKVIEGGEAQLA